MGAQLARAKNRKHIFRHTREKMPRFGPVSPSLGRFP